MKDIYLVGAARTPIGRFGGALAGVSAAELGAAAAKASLERAGLAAVAGVCGVLVYMTTNKGTRPERREPDDPGQSKAAIVPPAITAARPPDPPAAPAPDYAALATGR